MNSKLAIPLAVLITVSTAARGEENWSLTWCELGPVVIGKKVRLDLSDGDKVQGRALAMKDSSLRLAVLRSTDSKRYPSGESVSFTRDSVREVRILIKKGVAGRVLATTAGVVGGLFVGLAVGIEIDSAAAFIGTWAGSSVGGYMLGEMADRNTIRVSLQPGDDQCGEPPEMSRSGGSTRSLAGLGGEPTYAPTDDNPVQAAPPAGGTALRWAYDWERRLDPQPAESRSDDCMVPGGVSDPGALR